MPTPKALKDGFSVLAESPRTAVSTTFMSPKAADEFDEQTEEMAEWMIRQMPLRRFPTYYDED